jgi:hypothetical protein
MGCHVEAAVNNRSRYERPTVFFASGSELGSLPGLTKIDRLMPIVADTEQIPNRPNFRLKSKAQIFDGSGDGSLPCMEKLLCWIDEL